MITVLLLHIRPSLILSVYFKGVYGPLLLYKTIKASINDFVVESGSLERR